MSYDEIAWWQRNGKGKRTIGSSFRYGMSRRWTVRMDVWNRACTASREGVWKAIGTFFGMVCAGWIFVWISRHVRRSRSIWFDVYLDVRVVRFIWIRRTDFRQGVGVDRDVTVSFFHSDRVRLSYLLDYVFFVLHVDVLCIVLFDGLSCSLECLFGVLVVGWLHTRRSFVLPAGWCCFSWRVPAPSDKTVRKRFILNETGCVYVM